MSKELEGGSLEWISVPAFQHDLVHIGLSHANLFRVGLRLWIQDVSWVGHSVSPFNLFVKGINQDPQMMFSNLYLLNRLSVVHS